MAEIEDIGFRNVRLLCSPVLLIVFRGESRGGGKPRAQHIEKEDTPTIEEERHPSPASKRSSESCPLLQKLLGQTFTGARAAAHVAKMRRMQQNTVAFDHSLSPRTLSVSGVRIRGCFL